MKNSIIGANLKERNRVKVSIRSRFLFQYSWFKWDFNKNGNFNADDSTP